jgi:hypothetical protein
MKWEYITISIEAKGVWNKNFNEKASVEKLNQLGAEGWELVSVTPIERTGAWTQKAATYAFAFIFKRPSNQEAT